MAPRVSIPPIEPRLRHPQDSRDTPTTSAERSPVVTHALAALGFVFVALFLSYPLVLHLSTHVPGVGAGDNLSFLWNFWWFRTPAALAHPFECSVLFAPVGTSLVLDTHTALPAIVGATVLRSFDIVTACNLTLLAGLTLNGWVTYLLAWHLTKQVWPSVLAGVVFSTAAYISIHLLGHFNLAHPWIIVLVALAWIRFIEDARPTRACALAGALAVTTYTDYYYTVYAVVFVALWWFAATWRLEWAVTRRAHPPRAVSVALLVLAIADVVTCAAIVFTGGLEFNMGSHLVSATHTRGLRSALWILLASLACLNWTLVPRLVREPATPRVRGAGTLLAVSGVVYLLLISPLAIAAVHMILAGDYVSDAHYWISSPRGVDVATLVLGHPLHRLYGALTRKAYDAFSINIMEQSAWLGLVAIVTLIAAIRSHGVRWLNQPWALVGAAFLVWSLGPFLTIGGTDTALILPRALLRYVPGLSNARMPGRAIIVAQMALAMLAALWAARSRLRTRTIGLLVSLALADAFVAPFPLYHVPAGGSVEAALRAAPSGTVLELPTGLADGFGDPGATDRRSLAWQMQHGHALVGGFVARLSNRVTAIYQQDPLLWRIIRLSGGHDDGSATVALPADPSRHLLDLGIRYVVVNRDTARAEVIQFALTHLTLRPLAADGPRELYAIEPPR